MAEKSKTVAVFMYDGSDKYHAMTVNAIKSFLSASHNVTVGILVPPSLRQPDWGSLLGPESRGRLDVRHFRTHFTNWNPTQHKLDIELYADTYDFVLWIDSDTVSFADVGKLVAEFAKSPCQFALVEDLVTSKPNFQQRWQAATGSANPRPFVPQTALMIFRKSAFARVFPPWEATWRKWIEPAPFAHYGDPDPAFQGSAFCIEQYALGLALEQLSMLSETVLFRIPRRQILFKDVGSNGGAASLNGQGALSVPLSSLVGGVSTHSNASVLHSSYGSSGSSYAVVPVAAGSYQLTSYYPASLSSYNLGSYQGSSYGFSSAGSATSYQVGSYQQHGLTSYQAGSYNLGAGATPYQAGSYQLGSAQVGSYQLGSAQVGSYQAGSYQGSQQLGSLQLGSYTESARASEALGGTHLVGVIALNTGLNYDIVVDSFAGSVLHFYSFNYEPGYAVWQNHGPKVRETLDAVWAAKP